MARKTCFLFFYVFVFFDSLRNPTKLARILRNLSKLRRLRRSLADFVGFRRFRMISLYFLWFRRIYIDFVGLRERNKNSKEKCNKNKKKHKTVLFRTNKTFLLRSASLPLGLVAARPRCLCWVGPFIYLLVLPRCWGLGPLNIGAAMPDLGCWHTSILVFLLLFTKPSVSILWFIAKSCQIGKNPTISFRNCCDFVGFSWISCEFFDFIGFRSISENSLDLRRFRMIS